MNSTDTGFPWRKNMAWILFSAAMLLYAVWAMQSGVHNLPNDHKQHQIQLLDEIVAKSDQGVPYAEVEATAKEAFPWWNNLLAQATGTHFGFGTNGPTEPVRYYASMKPVEQSVLSAHMILGGACLVLGIFQFWPAFRRKYRKAHRAIGGLYILCAYTMVGAAVYHLLHTGVANTYQGFTFYIQLWFLVISTTVTQTLAIYFVKKRNFSLHFGFQAYTYAAFLSAPLQRYDWFLFGKIYPHLSQGEVNNLVNLMGFWQCILAAYLIFAWNRASSPVRQQPPAVLAPAAGKQIFIWTLAGLGLVTTVAFYLVWPGLGQWQVAREIVPASTLAADAALFDGRWLQNLVFTVSTGAAMFSGVWLLMRNDASRLARNAFYLGAAVSGLIQLSWGWQLGEPNMQVIAGGGLYYITGLSLLAFAAAAYGFQQRGNENLWREMMVFGANFAFAPALLLWFHWLWAALGVIPQQYLDIGHGYILAAGGAILTPTFNGFIEAITSRESQARAIS